MINPAEQNETAAEAALAVRRASAAYFALQGAAVLAWWAMLWQMPATRAWFTPPGWPQSTLTAFWLPDLALAAGGSLAAAWLSLRGSAAAGAARWFVAGAMAYGTLFCLGASLATDGAWLSVALMVPGALASLALAAVGSVAPARLYHPAAPGSAGRNMMRTLAQCAVVWSLTLAVVPFALLVVDAALGLPRMRWAGQGISAAALFIAFSALNLWAAFTFATQGQGTPLPAEAPRRLVVRGPYARIRNPMALAGLGQGLAVALGFGSWLLLAYVAAGALLWNYGLRPAEERDLLRRFGAPYADYRRQIRCWIPSLRPYPRTAEPVPSVLVTSGEH
jgi:protein-S-isoprenylcysteine O-methyltransferase Ste14